LYIQQAVGRKRFQFERYWVKLGGFAEVVQSAWGVVDGDPDPFRRLTAKLKRMARQPMSWSNKKVANIKLQLMTAREVVLRLDMIMESRPLFPDERRLRALLKHTYLGLASLERTMARQRAKIACLSEGDANTSFFHQHASYRRQNNAIRSLQVDGAVISDLLGTSLNREFSLDLEFLGLPSEDLAELEAPFTEEEISEVVR
jgi:hypothetical protein